jgi:general secretion pathway protein E
MEVMPLSDGIRSQIMRHAVSGDLRKLAVKEGMQTIYENGLRKAVSGITTIDEVLRVTTEA